MRHVSISKYLFKPYSDWHVVSLLQRPTGEGKTVTYSYNGDGLLRKLTSEEMNEELELVPHWMRPEAEENVLKFSKDTENQIIDIGIYFSSVLLHSSNQLKWMVIHKPRNHVDVNQPVLAGTGKIRLNPIRVVDVCAARVLNDAGNIKMLSDLYVWWREKLLNH
ncbi:hypothetical protein AB3N00_24155 [Paenibacillus xylanilyticus]